MMHFNLHGKKHMNNKFVDLKTLHSLISCPLTFKTLRYYSS